MRRILLAVLLCVATAALPTSAAVAKPKPKPATFKVGTYKAKTGTTAFNITLAKTKCTTTPGEGAPATHLCVSLPAAPEVECHGAANETYTLGSYATPVALSSSGAATEKTAITAPPPLPGAPAQPGTTAFSVSFTKKGTAVGYLELNLTATVGIATIPCASGKIPFTAKLG